MEKQIFTLMKKFGWLCTCCLAILFMASCTDDEEDVKPSDSIILGIGMDKPLEVLPEGGAKEILFLAKGDWTVTCDSAWVILDKKSGKVGEMKLGITVEANPFFTDRTATVTLTCGAQNYTVKVLQKALGASILFDVKDTLSILVRAEAGTVTVTANVDWAIEGTLPEWLTVDAQSGMKGETKLVFTVKDQEVANRYATIVLKDKVSSYTSKLVVEAFGVGEAYATYELNVAAYGASDYDIFKRFATISVSSAKAYTTTEEAPFKFVALKMEGTTPVAEEVTWAHFEVLPTGKAIALNKKDWKITLDPNTAATPRSASVYLVAKNMTPEQIIADKTLTGKQINQRSNYGVTFKANGAAVNEMEEAGMMGMIMFDIVVPAGMTIDTVKTVSGDPEFGDIKDVAMGAFNLNRLPSVMHSGEMYMQLPGTPALPDREIWIAVEVKNANGNVEMAILKVIQKPHIM